MVIQRIFPAIIAGDQKDFNSKIKKIENVSRVIHLDFMDGKFVKNKSLGLNLRLKKGFYYHAHLMVDNPKKYVEKYKGRIGMFLNQWESIKNKKRYINWLKKNNQLVGFALKPETKISEIKEYLTEIDFILILTVHPGKYGAKFLKSPLKKIEKIKRINQDIKIIVDGGMNPKNIKFASKANADFFVSGSYVTKSDNPKKNIKILEKKLN